MKLVITAIALIILSSCTKEKVQLKEQTIFIKVEAISNDNIVVAVSPITIVK